MPSAGLAVYLARSIILYHCLSLFIAFLILALSIRDCGILSLCLNPFFAVVTIGYHVTILMLAYKRPEDAPVLPVGYTIAAYLLAAAWLGAYIAMAIVLCTKAEDIPLFSVDILIPQQMRITQKIQIMLDPFESVLIGCIAIKSTVERCGERRWSKTRDQSSWDVEDSVPEASTSSGSSTTNTQRPPTIWSLEEEL